MGGTRWGPIDFEMIIQEKIKKEDFKSYFTHQNWWFGQKGGVNCIPCKILP